jgi:large subunit ribosomal protein L18
MRTEQKHKLEQLRHWRVRKKNSGTKERPRMSVCFTNKNIHVQFIDDAAGVTLAAASTTGKSIPDRDKLAANVASAKTVGKLAAEAALAKGIKAVVFDRGGARYHWSKPKEGKDGKNKDAKPVLGKLAALAEAAREAGLKF